MNGNNEQYGRARDFIANALIYHVDDEVAEATILMRQKCKIKMPDAIIASTAALNNMTLVTGNAKDFANTGVNLLIPEI